MAESPLNDSRKKYLREEYTSRINRVTDYIEANIGEGLSLEKIAAVAGFSPFHFHRIFGAMTGETLNQFILRIRIEKAASLIVNHPRKSITEIALDCGFSGPSTFARAFRDGFGMSASRWRAGGCRQHRKISEMNDKTGKQFSKIKEEFIVSSGYTGVRGTNWRWRVTMTGNSNIKAEVEVKDTPEFQVAYVRHVGPYAGDSELFGKLFGKLMKWAGPRGLMSSPDTKILAIYHDDPNITEAAKLRTSVCVSVPADMPVEGEIGKMAIPAGKYAVARFEISPEEYADAWNAVFGGWLPESGYQPADGPCYELFLNNPDEHPEKKHIFDICVPVKPL